MSKRIKVIVENGMGASIAGIQIPHKPVPVHIEWDLKNTISFAEITKDTEHVYANLDIPDKYNGLYPSLGIAFSDKDIKDGVISKCHVFAVGLSGTPNADPSIPPIKIE